MDIDTSSITAARRNLVLISIGFILFSLGGATLIETVLSDGTKAAKITILFGSFTINTDILEYFSIVMFAWFLLRFWQFSKHKRDWCKYTKAMHDSSLMLSWFKKNELTRCLKGTGFRNSDNYQPVFGIWEWPTNSNATFVIQKNNWLKKIVVFTNIAITTELFGQYYFPYCLALASIVITLMH